MRVIVPIADDFEMPEFSRVILEEERQQDPKTLEKVEIGPEENPDSNSGAGANE